MDYIICDILYVHSEMLCWILQHLVYSVKPIQFNLQRFYHTNPAKPLLSIRNVHFRVSFPTRPPHADYGHYLPASGLSESVEACFQPVLGLKLNSFQKLTDKDKRKSNLGQEMNSYKQNKQRMHTSQIIF